jgi:hypothetical protein
VDHALFKLARGLVGKGDRQNLLRIDAVDLEQISDAVNDGPCFSRARPGEDQSGAFVVLDGGALLVV